MARTYGKNNWALFLLLLTGIVLGSFLGHLTQGIGALSWLNYGLNFSIGSSNGNQALIVDLGVIVLQFGLKIKITIGSILGVLLSFFIYRRL